MDYLICQEWANTSGNHAGIKYLCCELARKYPNIYKVYIHPDYLGDSYNKKFFYRNIIKYRSKLKNLFYNIILCRKLKEQLCNGDRVFLMEYMDLSYSQLPIARMVKSNFPKVTVYGMLHLVPSVYDEKFSDEKFKLWSNWIDKYITLGSSLSEYLNSIRLIPKIKIVTLFHYVDLNYYKPEGDINVNETVSVIAMGNMKRDYKLLEYIVKKNPNVVFYICQGMQDLSKYFGHLQNVQLIPYIGEDELRCLMSKADISLNTMVDTVGSNVIVTSMSMGLAMVCSDVGSIRDYCQCENSILCDNGRPQMFSDAILKLSTDKKLLLEMKKASRGISEKLSIEKFHQNIQKI